MSKAENLEIMKKNGINIPEFIIVDEIEKIDLSFSDSEKFAVRSSYSAEDGEQASYAGQFATLLNVGRNEISKAAEEVFSSYSRKNYRSEISSEKQNIIIQEMINADFSGIIFTSNPLGILNEIVIVVGNGIGNNVVEDKIETANYYYNCDDEQYFYTLPDGMERLSADMLSKLVENALKIKNIFNRAMDIEFAVWKNELYILQARPITAFDDSELTILDNSNISESYPARTLPLTHDFAKEIYYRVFKSCVNRIIGGKAAEMLDDSLRNMVDSADGSLYYRIENWYSLLKLLPFSGKIIAVWQRMIGVSVKTIPEKSVEIGAIKKAVIAFRFLYLLKKTPKNMAALNEEFERRLPEYRRHIAETDDVAGLLKLYHRLIELISSKWDITLINDMYAFIFTAAAEKKHERELADIADLKSLEPVLKMEELIETARKFSTESEEYLTARGSYIEEYGDRCFGELKLETATYRTDPKLLDDYVRLHIGEKNQSEKIPEKIGRENFFVKRAKLGISNREISRLNRSKLFGLAREIMLKIGEILAKESVIDDRRDVFYLYENELRQNNLKNTVRRRKIQYENYNSMPVFGRIVYTGKVFDHDVLCAECGVAGEETELRGIPTSRGKVEGEVLVIDSPTADIDTTGKIIVTVSTDPSWVFLIKNALGIIAEKGSLLSHTAIVTRELGKPSIVNVRHAASILKTGDKVILDANSGIIRRYEKMEL